MLLSDEQITGYQEDGVLEIEPFNPSRVQPASVDLTLDRIYRVPSANFHALDVADIPEGHTEEREADESGAIRVPPESFLLVSTRECVKLPSFLAARVEGKSSIGRLGLAVHITAGFIDPGFHGNITLEIANVSPWAITLREGMPICQIAFMTMSASPARDYSLTGHYQGQRGPTESRYRIR